MSSNPPTEQAIVSLVTPQDDFSAIVKLAVGSKPNEMPRIDLLYLRFIEDRPDEHALASAVYNQVINYAIPKSKVLGAHKKSANGDASHFAKLQSEARRAFIEYTRSSEPDKQKALESRYSEVGEIIAFCVANHYLNAGQVAAKMALKTNSEMPVFGIDGIHALQDEDGTLNVFYLESKMVNDQMSGLGQYLDSATSFYNNEKLLRNELRICHDLSNLDIIPEPARETALNYFNPYSKDRSKVRERFVGVITYDEPLFKNSIPVSDANAIDIYEKSFLSEYQKTHAKLVSSATTRLENRDAQLGKFRTFYIAVPSVSTLKELFAKEMR